MTRQDQLETFFENSCQSKFIDIGIVRIPEILAKHMVVEMEMLMENGLPYDRGYLLIPMRHDLDRLMQKVRSILILLIASVL